MLPPPYLPPTATQKAYMAHTTPLCFDSWSSAGPCSSALPKRPASGRNQKGKSALDLLPLTQRCRGGVQSTRPSQLTRTGAQARAKAWEEKVAACTYLARVLGPKGTVPVGASKRHGRGESRSEHNASSLHRGNHGQLQPRACKQETLPSHHRFIGRNDCISRYGNKSKRQLSFGGGGPHHVGTRHGRGWMANTCYSSTNVGGTATLVTQGMRRTAPAHRFSQLSSFREDQQRGRSVAVRQPALDGHNCHGPLRESSGSYTDPVSNSWSVGLGR
ncbi:hypothetical protein V8C35DRAFT_18806 [Trichoderma chlorosporum]